jgi:2-C-methyl-D-erythritol 4-phosphate cytidylyltransferase
LTNVAAIVVAAGQGKRFGGEIPKQLLHLQNRPVLVHSLQRLEHAQAIRQIVLVVAKEWLSHIGREIVGHFHFEKIRRIVPGGRERQDSVFAGLLALTAKTAQDTEPPAIVVVHDAVRPLFSLDVLESVIKGCETFDACIPGLPLRDTVKRIEGDHVVETVPRESLRLAQTPQAFRYEFLRHAFEMAHQENFYTTDEAALVEHYGGRVGWIDGEETNLKITTPRDLQIAELFLQEKK